jgi:hypothetical protein
LVTCKLNSEEFVDGLRRSMRCCRSAVSLLDELRALDGVDFVQFKEGKVRVIPYANANQEVVRIRVLEIINRYPNHNSG